MSPGLVISATKDGSGNYIHLYSLWSATELMHIYVCVARELMHICMCVFEGRIVIHAG